VKWLPALGGLFEKRSLLDPYGKASKFVAKSIWITASSLLTKGSHKLFASNGGFFGHCERKNGAKQSLFPGQRRDCFVAAAPRNDNLNVTYFVLSLVKV
jgi:hypothetical protein